MRFLYAWFLPFVLAFIISLVLYALLRDKVYIVDGGGMMPNLSKGEMVLLKKAEKISKNDILLIDNPLRRPNQSPKNTLKRCVGLPGDTVEIRSKNLFINGLLQRADFCQFDRKFSFFSTDELNVAAYRYKIFPAKQSNMTQTVAVPERLFKRIKSENIVKNISDGVLPEDMGDRCLYPFSPHCFWNRDFYGPLVVPKKGLTIKLSFQTVVYYKFLFEKFEGITVVLKDHKYFVDGKPAETYTFKNDYYFVLNDYRDDVSDSRTFGPVRRDLILGKYFYSGIFR